MLGHTEYYMYLRHRWKKERLTNPDSHLTFFFSLFMVTNAWNGGILNTNTGTKPQGYFEFSIPEEKWQRGDLFWIHFHTALSFRKPGFPSSSSVVVSATIISSRECWEMSYKDWTPGTLCYLLSLVENQIRTGAQLQAHSR